MIKSHNLRSQKGFTIVELLIVIVVIGILAALVLNSFAGVQAKARDTERATDTKALSTQLEAYYNGDGQGGYPVIGSINTDAGATSLLKGIDTGSLRAPSQTSPSLVSAAAANKDQYGYQTYASDGTTACTTAPCAKYKITYWRENLPSGVTNPITINSLN